MQIQSTPKSLESRRRSPRQPNLSNREVALRPIDARWWELLEIIDYAILLPIGLAITIVVPRGFKTDLASVPRFLWAFFPPFGNYTAAAVIHDYLYAVQAINGMPITRADADRIFLTAMRELGVSWSKSRVMWLGVRAGGMYAWWTHISEKQQKTIGESDEKELFKRRFGRLVPSDNGGAG